MLVQRSVRTIKLCAIAPIAAYATDFLRGSRRWQSQDSSVSEPLDAKGIDDFLSKPDWSVRSLLPSEEDVASSTEVTSTQLHHLLRLSALPPPETPEQEAKMLKDLRAQLHFVKEIQKVDTTGVQPLRSLRDETAAAEEENEISMETLKDAIANEEVVGKYHKRIRRKQVKSQGPNEAEDWDVLGQAPKKVGRFFVVEGGGG
ncbi:MAG: hypothetical protein M1828_003963 [Chrysothrix sp. TS-e1954]|nr:MAG: hypothetical protein M1828_003963 [Chrysothrix sp. TS-e1954]